MYKIHQFSWHFRAGEQINTDIKDGKDILTDYNTVLQLGIQAPPGTLFTLNAGNSEAASAIEIGDTGIYELDLKNSLTYISTLYLRVPSYLHTSEELIAKEAFDVIIDILYEE